MRRGRGKGLARGGFAAILNLVLFLVPLGGVVSLGYGAVQRLWEVSEPRLRQALAGEATRYLGSRVEIRRLSLSSHGITLRGVTIADPAELELARPQPIAEATEVRVPFDASFVQRLTAQAHEPLIDTVHLQSLHLVLRRDSDGRWNVSRLIKPSRVPPKRTWLGALELERCTLEIEDHAMPAVAGVPRPPVTVRLERCRGQLLWDGPSEVVWRVRGDGAGSLVGSFLSTGSYDSYSKRLFASAEVHVAEVPPWAKRFLPAGYEVTKGVLDGSFVLQRNLVQRSGGTSAEMHYVLRSHVKNVDGAVPWIRGDVRIADGLVSVEDGSVRADLSGTAAGERVRVALGLDVSNSVRYDVAIHGPELALPRSVHAVRAFDGEPSRWLSGLTGKAGLILRIGGASGRTFISGTTRLRCVGRVGTDLAIEKPSDIVITASGSIGDPGFLAKATLPACRVRGVSVSNVHGMAQGSLKATHAVADARIAGGSVNVASVFRRTHSGWEYEGSLRARSIRLDEAQSQYTRIGQSRGTEIAEPEERAAGLADADVSFRGDSKNPVSTANATVQITAPGYGRVFLDRAEVIGSYENGTVTIRRASAEIGAALAVLHGTFDPSNETGSLNVECDRVPLQTMAEWAGVSPEQQPTGTVALRSGHIEGDLRRPSLQGFVHVEAPRLSNWDADYAAVYVSGSPGSLAIDGEIVRQLAVGTLQGLVRRPFSGSPWLSADVAVRNLDVQEVASMAGTNADAAGLVSLTGTLDGPVRSLALHDAGIAAKHLWIGDLEVTGLKATAESRTLGADSPIQVTSVSAEVGGGSVEGSGEFSPDGTFNAQVQANDVSLAVFAPYAAHYADVKGSLSGSATARGTYKGDVGKGIEADLRLSTAGLSVNGETLGDLKAAVSLANGSVRGTSQGSDQPALVWGDASEYVSVGDLQYGLDTADLSCTVGCAGLPIEKLRRGLSRSPSVARDELPVLTKAVEAAAPVSGLLSGTAEVRVGGGHYSVSAELGSDAIRVADAPLGQLQCALRSTEERTTVEKLSAQSGEMTANGSAEIIYGKSVTGGLSAQNLSVPSLAHWLPANSPVRNMRGVIDTVTAEIAGQPNAPEINLFAAARGLSLERSVGGQSVRSLVYMPAVRLSGVTIREGQASFEDLAIALSSEPELGKAPYESLELHASGRLPFSYVHLTPEDDAQVEAELHVPEQHLESVRGFLHGAGVDLAGSLSGDVRLTSTVGVLKRIASGGTVSQSDISASGTLSLSADYVRFLNMRTALKDVNLQAQITENRLELGPKRPDQPVARVAIRGSAEGGAGSDAGDIRLSGSLPLIGNDSKAPGVHLEARSIQFDEAPLPGFATGRVHGELASEGDAAGLKLAVTGSLFEPTISGTVSVRNTALRLPTTDPITARAFSVGIIDPRFDISVALGKNVTVTNSLMATSLTTSGGQPIRLTGVLSAPKLAGSLIIESGKLTFPTARFTITKGGRVDVRYPGVTASETGKGGLEVAVNLTATSYVTATSVTGIRRRYRVTVEARGPLLERPSESEDPTAGRLKLTYRTEPPDLALSQAGVAQRLTALLGGQEAIQAVFSRQGNVGGVLMGQAVDYLGGALLPDVFGELGLGRTFGLEEFAVDYSSTGAFVLRMSRQLFGPFDIAFWRRVAGGKETVGDAGAWELRLGLRLRNAFRLTYSVDSQRTNAYLLEGVYSF